MSKRPRAYELFTAKRGVPWLSADWKVTARYVLHCEDGTINCVRLHAFPSGQVVHLSEKLPAKHFTAKPSPRKKAAGER